MPNRSKRAKEFICSPHLTKTFEQKLFEIYFLNLFTCFVIFVEAFPRISIMLSKISETLLLLRLLRLLVTSICISFSKTCIFKWLNVRIRGNTVTWVGARIEQNLKIRSRFRSLFNFVVFFLILNEDRSL